jgi:hypothetical protein
MEYLKKTKKLRKFLLLVSVFIILRLNNNQGRILKVVLEEIDVKLLYLTLNV